MLAGRGPPGANLTPRLPPLRRARAADSWPRTRGLRQPGKGGRGRRQGHHLYLRPVGDLGYRAREGRGRARPAYARGADRRLTEDKGSYPVRLTRQASANSHNTGQAPLMERRASTPRPQGLPTPTWTGASPARIEEAIRRGVEGFFTMRRSSGETAR